MTQDRIMEFLKASDAERLKMASSDEWAAELTSYLGEAGYKEYRSIAERTISSLDQEYLSIHSPKNLIFVPGVMGSLLMSRTLSSVWWVDARTRHHIDDLRLNEDGSKDADESHDIAPFALDVSYEAFLGEVLKRDDFGHTVFPYDWRKSLRFSAPQLKELIESLHSSNGNLPVHLVAHSMGGLMVRTTLMTYGEELWEKIGRIVFIGTPHYGSPAIASYLKNHLWGFDLMTLLGYFLTRETYRSLWGVLSLMPAPKGIYPGTRTDDETQWLPEHGDDGYVHPCANFDMYNVDAWQLGLTPEQKARLQNVLDHAAEFHRDLYNSHQLLDQGFRDRMAVIAGIGIKTLYRLAYNTGLSSLWKDMKKVTDRIPNDPHREGDGRVPLASAALEFVGDTRYVQGVHGELPSIPIVYENVFRWLNGKEMTLAKTPEAVLADFLEGDAKESEAPNLALPLGPGGPGREPDFYSLDPPDQTQIDRMEGLLENGLLPQFKNVRLL